VVINEREDKEEELGIILGTKAMIEIIDQMKDLFLHYCQRAKPSQGTVFVKFFKIRHMTSHCSICYNFFGHLKNHFHTPLLLLFSLSQFFIIRFLKHLNEVKRASAFSLLLTLCTSLFTFLQNLHYMIKNQYIKAEIFNLGSLAY
jgi:hypothetical protein